MLKNNYLLFFALLLSSSFLPAQSMEFIKADGKVITNESGDTILLRGMGLGGWMVQEGYMLQTSEFAGPQWEIREKIVDLVGEEETDIFYDLWLENNVQKIDIDSMKRWGFNSVRVPLHYNLFTLPIEEEPVAGQNTWLDKGFELTDRLISWCKENEMYVILDLHAAPGGQGMAQEISDYNPAYPSLWESQANRDKTVALWKRIAERYADEPAVGAYDLLNEPNWNLPGGTLLREIYVDITEAIREVDNNHLLIIEGNWFANDFTGLTNPWDDNLAFGPHKYWSFNNPSDNDWLIALRDNNNVPIYLGESGENSNVWYNDAIRLLESEGFSWAWWTIKKVESISGLFSINKSQNYQTLLNYWAGNGPKPSQELAVQALRGLAEASKLENCVYNHTVVDAMFRQVQTDEVIPFRDHSVPGIVHATDYDLGRNGSAYYDNQTATFHVTTGEFTAWNNGWVYRNDGVDIEPTQDIVNSNGFNVGWIDSDEWMRYSINVEEDGLYNVITRVATPSTSGSFRIGVNGGDVTNDRFVPVSGGYQTWRPVIVEDVMLTTDDEYFTFRSIGDDYNLSSFEFIRVGDSDAVDAVYTYAETLDKNHISVHLSKPLTTPLEASASDFSIRINGNNVPVASAISDPENNRKLILEISIDMIFTHVVHVTYSGNNITAVDDTPLLNFTLEPVQNNLQSFHIIPGLIEAEDFSNQSGAQLEDTTDDGLGQNIGFLDPGDYLDYEVNISEAGVYEIDVRHASEVSSGAFVLELIDEEGDSQTILNATFPSTNGWQNWETRSFNAQIPTGRYTMRMRITGTQFNVNWMDFKLTTSSTSDVNLSPTILLYPNPTMDQVNIEVLNGNTLEVKLLSMDGRQFVKKNISGKDNIDLSLLGSGIYIIQTTDQNGLVQSHKLIKI